MGASTRGHKPRRDSRARVPHYSPLPTPKKGSNQIAESEQGGTGLGPIPQPSPCRGPGTNLTLWGGSWYPLASSATDPDETVMAVRLKKGSHSLAGPQGAGRGQRSSHTAANCHTAGSELCSSCGRPAGSGSWRPMSPAQSPRLSCPTQTQRRPEQVHRGRARGGTDWVPIVTAKSGPAPASRTPTVPEEAAAQDPLCIGVHFSLGFCSEDRKAKDSSWPTCDRAGTHLAALWGASPGHQEQAVYQACEWRSQWHCGATRCPHCSQGPVRRAMA